MQSYHNSRILLLTNTAHITLNFILKITPPAVTYSTYGHSITTHSVTYSIYMGIQSHRIALHIVYMGFNKTCVNVLGVSFASVYS